VDDVDAFLAEVLPQLVREAEALHNGDATPRIDLWSHREPVTLFGALMTKRGWTELGPAFRWLASTFHRGESFEYEVLAAGVSSDLGYVVGIEHSVAARGERTDPVPYALRVTTVVRREDGRWKVVHRHGDPFDASTGNASAPAREPEGRETGHPADS
jgi:ketosteroid isomerase-like protein